MRIVVVYESLFGNTREIAEAIGDGLREARPGAEVDCLRVEEAVPETVREADLLVVGGPTHMHGMSLGLSRRMGLEAEKKAQEKGEEAHPVEPGAQGPGVRGWFHSLPRARHGAHAAAFDTRADMKMSGGAADGIARRLRGHGYELVTEPAGFIVEDTGGPLREGETAKARQWAASLR